MGRLYLDATGNYSDPTSTSYKYLRADGQWATPDMDHTWLDAAGEYTVPELWTPPEDIVDASWEEIARLSSLAAKNPQKYSSYIGQTKTIDLSRLKGGITDVTALVIGVGHDVGPDGKKLGLTFQLRDGFPNNRFYMYENNAGNGWEKSTMRWSWGPYIKNYMPKEISSLIKTMVKKTYMAVKNMGYQSATYQDLTETEDEFALLSQGEVFGSGSDPHNVGIKYGEGTQYEWYKQHDADSDRIIKTYSGVAFRWGLRSMGRYSAFMRVSEKGALDYGNPGDFILPALCFCV